MLSTNRNAYMRKWRDENRQGLGFFKDKQALLKKALSYLVKYAH